MNNEQQIINKLFRDLVRVYSSTATSMIGLESFIKAINELECDRNMLLEKTQLLSNTIQSTEPRMFPLDNFMLMLDKKINLIEEKEKITKEYILQILNEFKIKLDSDLNILKETGSTWIENGDCIVIHSIEENIEHLIPEAKKRGTNFKILLLKQDITTTSKILKILNKSKINFEVIPEHDLIHYFDQITKLFIGTQSLTKDMHIICDPGTSNIVSECHIHKIPTILFLQTLKFSHYRAINQNIRKNSYIDKYEGIEYNFSIHSNDVIDLDHINHIVTEKGEISKNQVSNIIEEISKSY